MVNQELFHFSSPTRQTRTALMISATTTLLIAALVKSDDNYHLPVGGVDIQGNFALLFAVATTLYLAISFFISAWREVDVISELQSLQSVRNLMKHIKDRHHDLETELQDASGELTEHLKNLHEPIARLSGLTSGIHQNNEFSKIKSLVESVEWLYEGLRDRLLNDLSLLDRFGTGEGSALNRSGMENDIDTALKDLSKFDSKMNTTVWIKIWVVEIGVPACVMLLGVACCVGVWLGCYEQGWLASGRLN